MVRPPSSQRPGAPPRDPDPGRDRRAGLGLRGGAALLGAAALLALGLGLGFLHGRSVGARGEREAAQRASPPASCAPAVSVAPAPASAPTAPLAPASVAATASAPVLEGGAARSVVAHAAAAPTPRASSASAPGSDPSALDPASLSHAVAMYKPALRRRCWDHALDPATMAAPSANVTVLITVATDGVVTSAAAAGDPPSFARCVEGHLRGWRFAGAGRAVIPLQFTR